MHQRGRCIAHHCVQHPAHHTVPSSMCSTVPALAGVRPVAFRAHQVDPCGGRSPSWAR